MKFLRWMLILTLFPLLPALAAADQEGDKGGPPGQTPAGTQPATPGGGNPNARSDEAATPAVPGRAGEGAAAAAEVPELNGAEQADFCDRQKDLREAARERWEAMTPEQREEWIKAHPALAGKILVKKWRALSPEAKAAFLESHPDLKQRVIERWKNLSPRERRRFCGRHPRLMRSFAAERRESAAPAAAGRPHQDQGVRDHGAGQGRDGVGQGGERRAGGRKK